MKRYILFFTLFLSVAAFAQHNEQVVIEGTYRPTLNKAGKILIQPETPEQGFEIPDTDIEVMDIDHPFPILLDKLSPLAYDAKKVQKNVNAENFLLAGIGTRLSPVFFYKHNSNLTKNLALGVGINHNSSWIDIRDYDPSSFMNNEFDISLISKRFSGYQMGAKVYYKNDMYHYYGVDHSLLPAGYESQLEQICPKQVYNTIGTTLQLASTSTRLNELKHNARFDYHHVSEKVYNASENALSVDYALAYDARWWGSKENPQRIGVDAGLQFDNCQMNTNVPNQSVLGNDILVYKLSPYFEMKDDFYRLHLGFRVDGAAMDVESKDHIGVHPDLSGSLFVFNKKVEFYAGLNGGRKLFTYSDMISENPFVGCAESQLVNVKMGFEGGVRTNVMETVDVHVGVRYRHTENDPFYYALYPYYNRMTVDYDETRQVSVLADVRWLALDKLTIDAGFAYHDCTPEHFEYAVCRPTTEVRLKAGYDVNQKLSCHLDFLYEGGRYSLDNLTSLNVPFVHPYSVDGISYSKMKDIVDLGLGADYKVQDQLTVFAKLDNVLNCKYQIYPNCPVAGIQLFVGAKMTF